MKSHQQKGIFLHGGFEWEFAVFENEKYGNKIY